MLSIGVAAQSTLEGHNIFAGKICMKNLKMTEFYTILARKIIKTSKIPGGDFARDKLQNTDRPSVL